MSRKIWLVVGILAVAAGGLLLASRRGTALPKKSDSAPPAPAASRIAAVKTGAARTDRSDSAPDPAACPIQFREVTDDTGIAFQHVDGSSGAHHIIESMTAGLATLDFDGDGLIDVYFPNGAALPGTKYDRPPRHALYKNLGGWRFEDVTQRAGVACEAFGLGIAVGDYDNDGWPDFYLNNYGPNILFRGNGDGTFSDVTKQAGGAGTTPSGVLARKAGAGACFFDYDLDGNPDLYVGNYIELDLSKYSASKEVLFYGSPLSHAPSPDTLYRNQGDGTFADVSNPSGIAAHSGRSMGMTSADYDTDGRPDVFVCNDLQENFLFKNDGRGRFEQVSFLAAVALNPDGQPLANMAVDCCDFDNDGRLDFYTTNYQAQWPMLLRNTGDEMFEDVTQATGAGSGCFPYVKWGCGMIDFDNDGCKDLFVANGHTEDNIERIDRNSAYRNHNVLLRNTGRGKFVDVSAQCGIKSIPPHVARGVVFDDLDNDGDLDVVVLNSRERPSVLRNMLNEQGSRNHWLQIRLQGTKTNRDGLGARVRVVAGDLTQTDELRSGRGYQCHWGSRLHFGLGSHDKIDRLEVHWIGGGAEVIENVSVDRIVTITEGTAQATER